MIAANSRSTPRYWLMSVFIASTTRRGNARSIQPPIWCESRASGLQQSWQRVSSEQHNEQIGPE